MLRNYELNVLFTKIQCFVIIVVIVTVDVWLVEGVVYGVGCVKR